MKYSKIILALILITIGVVVGCTVQEEQITPTSSPIPQNPIISAENFNTLVNSQELVFQEAVRAKWNFDGSAFWISRLFSVALHDSQTLQQQLFFDASEYGAIYDVSPDGQTIAYSLDDEDVILFDLVAQEEQTRLPFEQYVQSARFSTDGKTIGTTSREKWLITLWDVENGSQIKELTGFETAAPIYGFVFGADNQTLLWIARGSIQAMDIETSTLKPGINHQDFISSQALSPDGSLLATGAAAMIDDEFSPTLHIWDTDTSESITVFTHEDYFSSLSFSPDSKLLAAGSLNKVLFYDVDSMQFVGELVTGNESVNSLAFSPDGSRLITCGTDGHVFIWQVSP